MKPRPRVPWPGLKRLLGPAVPLSVTIAGWALTSDLLLTPRQRFLLPPPEAVVRVAFLDDANRNELLSGLGESASVAISGLACATALGVALAVLMCQARWLERVLFPYLVVVQATPTLALVPLFGFWFGFGFGTRVLTCVLIALFPIVTNTLFGLLSVDPAHRDLFALYGASRVARLRKLQFPSAVPHFLTGLRISAGLSVVGAIVGDFFFRQGTPGLGALIDLYRARLASEQLYGAVILASAFGLAVFVLFGALGRRVLGRWHDCATSQRA